jgi:hypothetical protein
MFDGQLHRRADARIADAALTPPGFFAHAP